MRKHYYLFVFAVISLFILASCSNNEYQEEMDKGIKSLGEKDYHQSSLYFELALKEKEGDEEAKAYLKQAKQMQNAIDANEQKKFNIALDELQLVIDDDNGLETVREEAQKLKEQILAEKEIVSSYEVQLQLVKDLIAKKSYEPAQKELKALQEDVETNEVLISYKTDISKLTEQVTVALNEIEELEKQKQEEIEAKADIETNIKKGEQVQYSTYKNERYGFTFQYPKGLTMDPPPTNGDGVVLRSDDELTITASGFMTNTWRQGETINTYYEEAINNIPVEISYKKLTKNWYVVSYVENGMIVYSKFFFNDTSANNLTITYPVDKQEIYGSITTHISQTFVPGAES